MAGTKISALTAAAALGGTEEIPGVQSAANVKITAAQIKTFTSASPTLVTPVLGVATGTSLALGGNGALSAPVFTGTGTWITGGTATTTKPYALIEPTGATSANWSTSGTGLGVNSASGFAGNLIDAQLNGAARFKVASDGKVTAVNDFVTTGGSATISIAGTFGWSGRAGIRSSATDKIALFDVTFTGFDMLQFGGTTSSFAGIKLNGAGLEVKLADNSAYTSLTALTLTATTFLKSGSYTVATVPSAASSGAGARIYVSDETGGATPAFSDATDWRRYADRAIIA